MIKIPLENEKRKVIQEKYWKKIENHTRIISELKKQENIKEIKEQLGNNNSNLIDFLYTDNNFNTENFKKIVTADYKQMLEYINDFKLNITEDISAFLPKKVFKYHTISKFIKEILLDINVSTCPYCNRQYTTALKYNSVRPCLDHYFPKKKYPFLAISLWNLIPCCNTCNLAKLDQDTYEYPISYPYKDEFGEDIIFTARLEENKDYVKFLQGLNSSFSLPIKNIENDGILPPSVSTQINLLHLQDLYNQHTSYVQNILKSSYIYSPEHIKQLLKEYPELFKEKEDVINLIYMTNIQRDNLINTPLSKLARDIILNLHFE